MNINGLVLIDKEKAYTSRDCVNILMKHFKTKKVGHAGTLDPFATGLLLIGINEGTKILPYVEALRKTYVATLQLGEETDTLDTEGTIIKTASIPFLTKEKINEVLNSFLGKQKQIPPMYSALKKDGMPLYKMAREGKEVEREARDIEVFDIKLINFEKDKIVFEAIVSKGTYIRTLGADIANRLNTVGYLLALRRTSIGNFNVSAANNVKDEAIDVISLKESLSAYKNLELTEEQFKLASNGCKLDLGLEKIVVTYYHNKVVCIYEYDETNKIHRVKRGINDDK